MDQSLIENYWQHFLAATGRDSATRYSDCFHFGSSADMADALLELVLSGQKRATASALPWYEIENEPVPKAGDLIILTNFAGEPKCVAEVTAVAVLPFRDITWEICKREGEDENLESWRAGHIHFFTLDGQQVGFEFTWDMPVVFEDFEVVYQ